MSLAHPHLYRTKKFSVPQSSAVGVLLALQILHHGSDLIENVTSTKSWPLPSKKESLTRSKSAQNWSSFLPKSHPAFPELSSYLQFRIHISCSFCFSGHIPCSTLPLAPFSTISMGAKLTGKNVPDIREEKWGVIHKAKTKKNGEKNPKTYETQVKIVQQLWTKQSATSSSGSQVSS